MPTLLRLTQHFSKQENHYRVEITLDGVSAVFVEFDFEFTERDRADVRWYLETYLQYPQDPAPEIAERIEKRLAELGMELFRKVFTGEAYDVWVEEVKNRLSEVRIEVVVADPAQATALPWELLRDPKSNDWLALGAQAFVFAPLKPLKKSLVPDAAAKVRILLVICRPKLEADVAFRSVAAQILKGLTAEARETFQLDVLRPPTFTQLQQTLEAAHKAGAPYHIVHFDGHGVYTEPEASMLEMLRRLSPLMLSGPREGKHGYVLFENPQDKDNVQLIDGPTLGRTLRDAGVPVLVLNACRSAHADSSESDSSPLQGEGLDPHSVTRAFGSLAQEVMDAGVGGVVAMRYNLFVVTAAVFVARLYNALASGQALGEAVSAGRKQLNADPVREIAFKPLRLQDWQVPVVYEAAPLQLFQDRRDLGDRVGLSLNLTAQKREGDLPPPPDVGFVGRDETLLALDRAFDTQRVVLLHAYAGSGKTSTAAEFARWYEITGGLSSPLQGEVLFTSFERHLPLPQVLAAVERTFGNLLQANNIHWHALNDDQRLNLTLQLFEQIPVLWIWDNVEPVAGFPEGTASAWSAAEQRALADFLRRAAHTRAKFLLTSRREERAWLGDLPRRIRIPPLPKQERAQLARAVADKLGHRLTEVEDWMPLLLFSQGNPMTLTVVVRQALTGGVRTAGQVAEFVRQLRAGETAFADAEQSEGRDKSLGASLSYGLEQAFTEAERGVLGLLHLFQGFVEVNALMLMGNPKADYALPELSGLTREQGLSLLNRAAGIGLLTEVGHGFYTIHPALPWFFRHLRPPSYAAPASETASTASGVTRRSASPETRAYVEAMGALGDYYHNQYGAGNRSVIAVLSAEEANLLNARTLARQNEWWDAVIKTMLGLDELYGHTGRRAEWKRLVEEIVPDFVGADDGPRAGREEQWSLVTQWRALLAMETRNWAESERLQRTRVEWNRRAAPALAFAPEALTGNQRNQIRTLAVSLAQLAIVLSNQEKPECVSIYEETIALYQLIGDQATEAITAFNLGHTYMQLPTLRDLAQAERWYQRSLELHAKDDGLGRGKCLSQLGLVARERFKEARKQKHPNEEMVQHLNTALKYYTEALALFPPNAVNELAVTHNQLGVIWDDAGDMERAVYHFNEDIRYDEMAQNYYGAAQTRGNVALLYANQGRFTEAKLFAQKALSDFERYGAGAAQDIEDTKRLLAWIDEEARK